MEKNFKTMKKVVVCAIFGLVSMNVSAQVEAFEKLAKIKGVEYTHVNKSMIEMAAKNGEDIKVGDNTIVGGNVGQNEILDKMDDIMVFTCEQEKDAQNLAKAARKLLKGKEWKSLIDVNEEDQKVKICTQNAGGKNTSAILAEEDGEVTLVVITGKFDIAQLMGAAGGGSDNGDDADTIDEED